MHRRSLTLAIALLAGTFAGTATAQDNEQAGLYAGLGLEQFRLSVHGELDGQQGHLETRPLALGLRVGWNAFTWLGLEAFAATGIHEDPNSGALGSGTDVRNGETELKSAYGGAVKPRYTFTFGATTKVTPYALLGYSSFEYEGRISDDRSDGPEQRLLFTLDDSAMYYGAGVQLEGGPAALTLQYVEYADEDNYDIRAWQLGVIKYF